jgi:predicted DNA-binding protein YlxM (UPF0122 family)
MLQTKVVEKIKTPVTLNNFFFSENLTFMNKCEKYGRARQAIDQNIRTARKIFDFHAG